MKANTVEDCLILDLAKLARDGLLLDSPGSGSLWWTNTRTGKQTASLGYRRERTTTGGWMFHLLYTAGREHDRQDIDEPIPLLATRPHFGGVRWWFICPLVVAGNPCQRRVGKLYLPPGARYFGCRHCHGLSYGCRGEEAPSRALRRAQKIRRRLGGSESMVSPFPSKPKRMHWRTYERLRWAHNEADRACWVGVKEWLERTNRRLERFARRCASGQCPGVHQGEGSHRTCNRSPGGSGLE